MSLKTIFTKLKKFQSNVEAELINRQNYFDSRSENWQESVRGDEYVADTECLQELNDSLNDGLVNMHPKDVV